MNDNLFLSALASAAYNTVMFLKQLGYVFLAIMGYVFMYQYLGGDMFLLAVIYSTAVYYVLDAYKCYMILQEQYGEEEDDDGEK